MWRNTVYAKFCSSHNICDAILFGLSSQQNMWRNTVSTDIAPNIARNISMETICDAILFPLKLLHLLCVTQYCFHWNYYTSCTWRNTGFQWKHYYVSYLWHTTLSTQLATPPKSTKSRNSDSSVSRSTEIVVLLEFVPRNLSFWIWWILRV